MNLPLVSLAILFSTAAVMFAALLMAWLYLGRLRYALFWALSSGGAVLQWTISAAARIMLPDQHWPLVITGALVAIDAALIALGARDRAGLPLRPAFTGAVIASASIGMLLAVLADDLAMRGFIANIYAAAMMLAAAAALLPRTRVATPPDLAVVSAFGIFGLLQIALAVVSLDVSSQDMLGTGMLYRNVLIVGLPAAYAGVGVAAVFVVAMDINERLLTLVTRDPLTGALNRRGLTQMASNVFAHSRRHQRPLAVAIVSVDGFEAARKRQGNDAIDRALTVIADVVHATVREEDILARIAQSEFCLLMIDSNVADAAKVIDRARAEIAAASLGEPGSPLTVSIGLTAFRSSDLVLAEPLSRADSALAKAATLGGNCTRIAS